jgi:hypothetical protein
MTGPLKCPITHMKRKEIDAQGVTDKRGGEGEEGEVGRPE